MIGVSELLKYFGIDEIIKHRTITDSHNEGLDGV